MDIRPLVNLAVATSNCIRDVRTNVKKIKTRIKARRTRMKTKATVPAKSGQQTVT